MKTEAAGAVKFPVTDREVTIINYLRRLNPGEAAPVREIWEKVSAEIGDTVTVQAYYKILDRLVAIGKVEEAGEDQTRGQLYRFAPHLHVANPATLDDIHEWVTDSMTPSEVIARKMDAMDYFEEKKSNTLKSAAEALLSEDPVELFYDMLMFYLRALQADLDIYHHERPGTTEHELRDVGIVQRIMRQYHDLNRMLYRWVSIPLDAVDITEVPEAQKGRAVTIPINLGKLKEVLKKRVFGKGFITKIDVSKDRGSEQELRMSVAGSDGSTHSGALAVHPARAFADESGLIVTFNNSIVYVEQSPLARGRIPYPFHSVPMTRSALDDPSNRGMVLARVMFDNLDESVYEHMTKCATDVVQWRVDAAVFCGRARALSPEGVLSVGHGQLLPAPTVHLRDGTVTLQEREFKHYDRQDAYGDFTREGVQLSKEILERVRSSKGLRIFGGATKSTTLKIFSRALNWYITEGSKKRFGKPLDPEWDSSRGALLSDNETMTALLSALTDPQEVNDGVFHVTCSIVRQFHSLTELYRPKFASGTSTDEEMWRDYFERLRDRRRQERQEAGGEMSYLELVEIEDDPYAWMCSNADYGLFYIGHTGGDPSPLLPRYEFMDSLRDLDVDDAQARVQRNVERILQSLDLTKFQLDQDHNYLTNKKIVKIIPQVIYLAHEHCKALGRQLESELKSSIVAQLQQIRGARAHRVGDVELLPVPVEDVVRRYIKAVEDDFDDDPDKDVR